jgi:hypothetical protein
MFPLINGILFVDILLVLVYSAQVIGECTTYNEYRRHHLKSPITSLYLLIHPIRYTTRITHTTHNPTTKPPHTRQNDVQRSTTRPRWPSFQTGHQDFFPLRKESYHSGHYY